MWAGVIIGARFANFLPISGAAGTGLTLTMGIAGGMYGLMDQTIARAQAPAVPYIK